MRRVMEDEILRDTEIHRTTLRDVSLSPSKMWAQRTGMRVFLVAPQLAIEYRAHFKPLVTPRTVRNAGVHCLDA
jgi:hypothetical protein